MSGPQRPKWVRLDVDWINNPKLVALQRTGRYDAITLWLAGLSYCAHHLTDGWVPDWTPKRLGFTNKPVAALEEAGLWHPLQIDNQGGWVINDYLDYQPSKEAWEAGAHQRRAAARARWQKR